MTPELKKYFFGTILLSLMVIFIESSFIYILQGFLRTLDIFKIEQTNLPAWYPSDLASSLIILLIFGLVRFFVHSSSDYFNGILIQGFATSIRKSIFNFSMSNVNLTTMAQTLGLFSDTTTRSSQAVGHFNVLITRLLCAFGYLIIGFYISPQLMITSFAMLMLLILPIQLFNNKVGWLGAQISSEWSKLNKNLVNGLRFNLFFRIYGILDEQKKLGLNNLSEYMNHFNSYQKAASTRSFLPNFLGIIVICSLSLVSVKWVGLKGANLLSFLFIFLRMVQTLSEAISMHTRFCGHEPSLLEIGEFLKSNTEIKNIQKKNSNLTEKNNDFKKAVERDGIQISIDSVTFSYQPGLSSLFNVSNNIKKGEVVVIIGDSGSGKSTLLHLIVGALKPTTGKISINNFELSEVIDFLPEYLGMVSSEPYLIPGTIRENLLFAHPRAAEVSESEIKSAIEMAQANFVFQGELNLETLLNENAQLSTGQKQRISLARAILRKPKLMILDEFTANLDEETERQLLSSLKPLFRDVTTIIVSHRPLAKEIATQIINLSQ